MSTEREYILEWLGRRGKVAESGEILDLEEHIALNEYTDKEIKTLRDLMPGDRVYFGGGAMALSRVRRIT